MTWNVCTDPSIGFDLSHWQGTRIPYAAAIPLGLEWVIAKTWHGRGVVTANEAQLTDARLSGVDLWGRYAWLLPDEDLDMQIGAWTGPRYARVAGELPLTIDFEEPSTKLRGRALLARAEYVVEKVSDRRGCRPILYTGNWYIEGHCSGLDSQILAECPLWLAAYPRKSATGTRYREAVAEVCGGAMPAVPRMWRDRGIEPVIWQADGDGGLVLPNGVDVDVNVAARARLLALRMGATAIPADAIPTRRDTPSAIAAVREPIADLSISSPATPLRAGEGEHTVRLEEA